MAGHEPEKGEVTSPIERLHNDIKKAINGTQIQRDTTLSTQVSAHCYD